MYVVIQSVLAAGLLGVALWHDPGSVWIIGGVLALAALILRAGKG